jgi:hypothetical protein
MGQVSSPASFPNEHYPTVFTSFHIVSQQAVFNLSNNFQAVSQQTILQQFSNHAPTILQPRSNDPPTTLQRSSNCSPTSSQTF